MRTMQINLQATYLHTAETILSNEGIAVKRVAVVVDLPIAEDVEIAIGEKLRCKKASYARRAVRTLRKAGFAVIYSTKSVRDFIVELMPPQPYHLNVPV